MDPKLSVLSSLDAAPFFPQLNSWHDLSCFKTIESWFGNGRASVVEHLFYQCPCDQTSTLALEGGRLQAVFALTFQVKYV